jgi:hydrogenase maturation protease
MIAIVGCGNANRSDDGAGLSVVRLLRERGLSTMGTPPDSFPEVRLFDTGTDGMAVMFAARGADTLVVVDACRSGATPGAVFEVPGQNVAQAHPPSMNLHEFRWDHALYAGRRVLGGEFPSEVLVILIEARSLAFGVELSPEAHAGTLAAATRIEAIVAARARARAGSA